MKEMVLCHTCKKSGPTMVANFDLNLPKGPDQACRAFSQGYDADNMPFSGHMEMYYFTVDDDPVTIMQTHLDLSLVKTQTMNVFVWIFIPNVTSHHTVWVSVFKLFEPFSEWLEQQWTSRPLQPHRSGSWTWHSSSSGPQGGRSNPTWFFGSVVNISSLCSKIKVPSFGWDKPIWKRKKSTTTDAATSGPGAGHVSSGPRLLRAPPRILSEGNSANQEQ